MWRFASLSNIWLGWVHCIGLPGPGHRGASSHAKMPHTHRRFVLGAILAVCFFDSWVTNRIHDTRATDEDRMNPQRHWGIA